LPAGKVRRKGKTRVFSGLKSPEGGGGERKSARRVGKGGLGNYCAREEGGSVGGGKIRYWGGVFNMHGGEKAEEKESGEYEKRGLKEDLCEGLIFAGGRGEEGTFPIC